MRKHFGFLFFAIVATSSHTAPRQMENLDRGLIAVKVQGGVPTFGVTYWQTLIMEGEWPVISIQPAQDMRCGRLQ